MESIAEKKSYQVNDRGYYGTFGGAFIPEMLYPNVEELRENYLQVIADPSFQKEFNDLLRHYVGRPTPLYHANRLSEKYKTNIFLKREDLCHTGAHKVNNTIGQILMAQRLGKKTHCRRNRRRPARRSNRYRLRIDGPRVHRVHGRARYRAPGT